ncbi:hypothetical protein FRB90_005845, partial [Tulasnella sp. 427]
MPQPQLPLDTNGVSSQSSCESAGNTPSDQQSLQAPSNLINYDDAFEPNSGSESFVTWEQQSLQAPSNLINYDNSFAPNSRSDSFVTWQLPESPIEEGYEMSQTPNPSTGQYKVPLLSPAPQTKMVHRPEAASFSVWLKELVPNRAYHNRSPSQEPVREPSIIFDGSDPSKCYDLIQEIVDYAWKLGKDTDKKWIARFAATRFKKRAVAWYSRLSDEVKYDWDMLHKALIEKYPLPPTPDRPTFLLYVDSGNCLTPRDVFVIPPNDDGPHLGPEPDHPNVHSTPKLSNTCLPESRGFHLTQNWQYGKIRVTGFGEVKPYYISKELNTLGGCWATPEKHEALCVKVKLGDCRNLYLE